jgi:hypothetical protein
LEGLEVSVLMKSDVLKGNSVFRNDAEYFLKKYLIEDNLRNKFQNKLLGDMP